MWAFHLQTFQDVNVHLHVQSLVSSCVWLTLSHVCILYKWLCFCVLYCTVLHRVQYLYFKPKMSENKRKSYDLVDTVLARHHWIIFFKRVDICEPSKEPEPGHQHQAWVKLQLFLHLLLLLILQLYRLLPPPNPPVITLLPVHSMPAPVCQRMVLHYWTFQSTVL